MQKKISILGSTGSIGKQTLDIVRENIDRFKVVALSAGKNIELLSEQIQEFKPEIATVQSSKDREKLKKILPKSTKIDILIGNDGLCEIAKYYKTNIVIVAVVGIVGLLPTLEAIKAKKIIALANKETLVAGGKIVMEEAKKYNVNIIPVDSEHSAIFQCIANNNCSSIKKIIITASGGPFRTWDKNKINSAPINSALAHPNWDMGPKVTIDSATLMNKTLEVIEAKWLFDIDFSKIEVLIHPQSIVHSMVEFIDGSVIAQLSNPTMHLPIQYALSYPDRLNSCLVQTLNLPQIGKLEFYPPDNEKFPALKFISKIEKSMGTTPTVINAANEVAINLYLNGVIKFYDIYKIIDNCLENHNNISNPTLEDILESDSWARSYVHNNLVNSNTL